MPLQAAEQSGFVSGQRFRDAAGVRNRTPLSGPGTLGANFEDWAKGQLRGGARAESCPEMSLERRIVLCDVRAGSIRRLKKGSRPKAGCAHSKVATRQQQSWFRQQFATA